jgi:hypothetical protein
MTPSRGLLYFLVFIIIFIVCVTLYVIKRGAIYTNKIEECQIVKPEVFCGIKQIDLSMPLNLRDEILDSVNEGLGKRIVIKGWKGGRTISTETIKDKMPNVWNWYKSLEYPISQEIGEKVVITQDYLPTTCAILVYESEGDFINWHYDVNYFEGRFFTLLIPVTFKDTCTEYTYYDAFGAKQGLKNEEGNSILFEGDKIFHMATKFCEKGYNRVVLSLQFATNSDISWHNKILMRIKDTAYIGIYK